MANIDWSDIPQNGFAFFESIEESTQNEKMEWDLSKDLRKTITKKLNLLNYEDLKDLNLNLEKMIDFYNYKIRERKKCVDYYDYLKD